MLGYILYETLDLLYHAGKLTISGVIHIYNWYYSIEADTNIGEEDKIKILEQRLNELEAKLREK